MNVEEIREYCLSRKGVTEGFPFDDTSLVFKVMGKIFAILNLEGETTINLKCDPQRAVELRDHFEGVQPGYHMNKRHWNTIIAGLVNEENLKEWIDHSWELVADSLPRKDKEKLKKR